MVPWCLGAGSGRVRQVYRGNIVEQSGEHWLADLEQRHPAGQHTERLTFTDHHESWTVIRPDLYNEEGKPTALLLI